MGHMTDICIRCVC